VALRDMAELHSSLAILLVGVTLGLAVALHAMAVPERVRRSARILCGVEVLQAAIGYTQYFTHLPAALVEVHVLGATTLVVGAVQFLLAMSETSEGSQRIGRAGGARAIPRRAPPTEPGGRRLIA
jgi:cytochrome c oxidase assembly protein subunit 15